MSDWIIVVIIIAVLGGSIYGLWRLTLECARADLATWRSYGVCDCGYKEREFISGPCPRCGEGRYPWDFTTKTMRFVNGKWETKP